MSGPSAIARLLASDPALWGALREAHVPDASGHCRGCRSSASGPPVWPCSLRAIADEAQRVATRQGIQH